MQPLSMPHSTKSMPSSMQSLRHRLANRVLTNRFLIRLRSWEYWPFWVVYVPVIVYWLWLSLKARSFFFSSASNPSIETGGLWGESKWDILKRIDPAYVPKTLLISACPRNAAQVHSGAVFNQLKRHQFGYPLIAKPNVGERGWRVEKIKHWEFLVNYIQRPPGDYLIQEFVDEPLEFGVFYYRIPGQTEGVVTSIVQKEFLSVTGNGRDTVEELMLQNPRAVLQLPVLQHQLGERFQQILAPGEMISLGEIGNHCLGTKFLNANHLITPEVTRLFDQISAGIDGFYFGRYDLRCRTIDDLHTGENLKIMELNGAGAEPAHIYQPGFSIWEAWRVLLHHWNVMYQISRENHRRGVRYMTLREAITIWKNRP